jgi:CubicO group peptidase (beta-lactamase class C family)
MKTYLLFSILLPLLLTVVSAHADKADDTIRARMQKLKIPGLSLAVIKNGKVIKERGYGLASIELNVPVTARTVFALASVTKVFTATAVMLLVEEGKLALEDTLGKLLPELPAAWHGVRVSELLSHTSGLPDVIVDQRTSKWIGETQAEAREKVTKLPMQFPSGTSWSYNQTNYMLLGMLIEKLSGKRVEAFCAERFFQPLGMSATAYGDARVVVPGRCTWYTRLAWDGNTPRLLDQVQPAYITYPDFAHTAAGLNATVGDLARWLRALESGKFLKPATLEKMWTAVKLADGSTFRMEKTLGVGMGWLVDDRPNHKAVGGTGGSSVAFRHYLDDKVTVILLTNCQGIDPDGLVEEIAALYIPGIATSP